MISLFGGFRTAGVFLLVAFVLGTAIGGAAATDADTSYVDGKAILHNATEGSVERIEANTTGPLDQLRTQFYASGVAALEPVLFTGYEFGFSHPGAAVPVTYASGLAAVLLTAVTTLRTLRYQS